MGRKDAINSSLDVIVARARAAAEVAAAAGRAGGEAGGEGRREWWCFTSHNYDYPSTLLSERPTVLLSPGCEKGLRWPLI